MVYSNHRKRGIYMYSFAIATDSSCDLPEEFIKDNEITVFNLSYSIANKTYTGKRRQPIKEFYNLMRAGEVPKTSQVNPSEAKEYFLDIIKSYKNVLYISFSSGLSGTFNSVRLAAMEIMDENPDVNIYVCDSLSASLGEGLLVYYAVCKRKNGMEFKDVINWVEENKLNTVHMFTVDDLDYLKRGGRISQAAATIGSVLSIKPILHMNNDGKLVPLKKERGRKRSLQDLLNSLEEKKISLKEGLDTLFISHGDCLEDALYLKEEINRRFKGIKCIIGNVDPIIGAHSGPGTVALFFLGEER